MIKIFQICQRKRLDPSPNTASVRKLDDVIQLYHMGDFSKSDILRKAQSFSVKFLVLMNERYIFVLVSMLTTTGNSIETGMN